MKKSSANSLLAADCLQDVPLSTSYLFFTRSDRVRSDRVRNDRVRSEL